MELIRHLKCGYFVGIIIQANGVEKIAEYTKNGTFIDPFGVPDERYDIKEVWPEKRNVVAFFNVYEKGAYPYATAALANECRFDDCSEFGRFIKTVRLETEVEA